MDLKSKIILIYGPTASGKSNFAIKLAKRIEGEIENGLAIGVWTEWYADGTKSFEGTRKRSVKKEKWTIWNEKIQRSISSLKK